MVYRWLLLVCLLATKVSCNAHGNRFIGVGYNLIDGNPDGIVSGGGGTDPGIKLSHRILQLHPGTNPPEVVDGVRSSCNTVQKTDVFYSTKTYQDVLKRTVTVGGSFLGKILGFEFTNSNAYKQIQDGVKRSQEVYFDEQTVCNFGRARYQEDLAYAKKFSVDDGFAAAVCALPHTYSSAYLTFLDRWGTHVIKEVELGTKVVKRFHSTMKEFFQHIQKESANNLHIGGSYLGFSASMEVDFSKFTSSSISSKQFGKTLVTLTRGSKTEPEPIAVKIEAISSALDPKFWQTKHCANTQTLQLLAKNIHTALDHYSAHKKVQAATAAALKLPLVWPYGTYGLPGDGGCPGNGVKWHTGWRNEAQHYEQSLPGHVNRPGHHGSTRYNKLTYCMKADKTTQHSSPFDDSWPEGDYCIYKYGPCPMFFHEGYIKVTGKEHDGRLPDGGSNKGYCCRDDGLPTHRITLPTSHAFSMFRYNRGCQEVNGMGVTEIHERLGSATASAFHPHITVSKTEHLISRCHYYPLKHGAIIG